MFKIAESPSQKDPLAVSLDLYGGGEGFRVLVENQPILSVDHKGVYRHNDVDVLWRFETDADGRIVLDE